MQTRIPANTYKTREKIVTRNLLYKKNRRTSLIARLLYKRYYFIASQLAWIASATSFADFPLV